MQLGVQSRCATRLPAKLSRNTRWPNQQCATVATAMPTYEAAPQAPAQRVFTEFSVYKQKGAVQARVISPTWKGAGPDDIRLERPGTMLLEFAEAIPGAGNAQGNAAGDRRYNWQQKESFALSAVELSYIIDPIPDMKQLVHDPYMKGSNAGSIYKSWSINRQPDGENWYMRLSVKSGQEVKNFGVNLSKQEFCCFQTIAKYVVPHLLGFDLALTNFNLPNQPEPAMNGAPF